MPARLVLICRHTPTDSITFISPLFSPRRSLLVALVMVPGAGCLCVCTRARDRRSARWVSRGSPPCASSARWVAVSSGEVCAVPFRVRAGSAVQCSAVQCSGVATVCVWCVCDDSTRGAARCSPVAARRSSADRSHPALHCIANNHMHQCSAASGVCTHGDMRSTALSSQSQSAARDTHAGIATAAAGPASHALADAADTAPHPHRVSMSLCVASHTTNDPHSSTPLTADPHPLRLPHCPTTAADQRRAAQPCRPAASSD